jgi:hypothetical protein
METQQMMEFLLKMDADREPDKEDLVAKLDVNQEKADADRKTGHKELLAKMEADRKIDKEERKADRVQMQEMMKMMQAYQAKTDAVLPATQVTETSHKETAAVIEPENEVERMACQGMEARPEEEKPTSAERKPEAAKQREVPAENAEVIPVGEPKKKRRRDQKLAAEHRRQKPNTSTRENCGPQKRLVVARSGSNRRGRVTWHTKEIDRKMSRRGTVARRKRDTLRKNLAQ